MTKNNQPELKPLSEEEIHIVLPSVKAKAEALTPRTEDGMTLKIAVLRMIATITSLHSEINNLKSANIAAHEGAEHQDKRYKRLEVEMELLATAGNHFKEERDSLRAEAAMAERIAQLSAHRACGNQEQDPANGKLSGYCVVCQVPWPCGVAKQKASAAVETERADKALIIQLQNDFDKMKSNNNVLRTQLEELKKKLAHPAIDVEYYKWLGSLNEFDRNFLKTASNTGVAQFAWQRSREAIDSAISKAPQ